jgi:hypothetical protein
MNPRKLPWQARIGYFVTYHRTEQAAHNAINRLLPRVIRAQDGVIPHTYVRRVALPA